MEIENFLSGKSIWHVETGNCFHVLDMLPDQLVQCCATSPPFFNLRRYRGVSPSRWPAGRYCPMSGIPACVDVEEMDCCLGLEDSLEAYVWHMVLVFRKVRRVLRDDGVVFLNLGDSYNANGRKGHGTRQGFKQQTNLASATGEDVCRSTSSHLKPKDLLSVPSRVGLALQADGWFWRQTVSWQKMNPMPGSQKDRPTSATEDILMLTKSARYYYDMESCRVPMVGVVRPTCSGEVVDGRNLWNWWDIADEDDLAKVPWKLSGEPPFGGHYAQWPSLIPHRCYRLGSSEMGCCWHCRRPLVRILSKPGATSGWDPGCRCRSGDPVPCVVMDPFLGAGSSGVEAIHLGRRFIGIEASEEYADAARRRMAASRPLFDAVASQNDTVRQENLFGEQ